MNEKINGFLVVRKSLKNFSPYNSIYKLDNKEYRGFERGHLEDISDDYFQKKLSHDLEVIIRKNGQESDFFPFMNFIKDYDDALRILNRVNIRNEQNEVMVFHSKILSEFRDSFVFDKTKIKWLGFDVISSGSSLILNGLFFKPTHFEKWRNAVNQNGLFTNEEVAGDYILDYLKVANGGNIIENYSFSDCLIIKIGVLED